jgi:hypothetical protein
MKTPKDRSSNSNRKPANNQDTDAELLEKFNVLHKKLSSKPKFEGSFSDDPKSRNTGWFFGGK